MGSPRSEHRFVLPRDELRNFKDLARSLETNPNTLLRQEAAHLFTPGARPLVARVLHWILRRRIVDEERRLERIHARIRSYDDALNDIPPHTPSWVVRLMETERAALLIERDETSRTLSDLRSEAAAFDAPAPTAFPILVMLNMPLLLAFLPVLLVAMALALLTLVLWRRGRLSPLLRAIRTAPETNAAPAEPQGESLLDREGPYESLAEVQARFHWNPDYLRLRIDQFLDRKGSLEALRQFCEDNRFSAVDEHSKEVPVLLLAFTEDALQNLPPEVHASLLSERTRRFALHASSPPVVEVAAGRNGHHRSPASDSAPDEDDGLIPMRVPRKKREKAPPAMDADDPGVAK